MSLTVPPQLLEQAQNGKVDDAAFTGCIAASLPYAWSMVARLAVEMRHKKKTSAQNLEVPATDGEWGQVFRLFSSTSMRQAAERHFGVNLAFQNCCKAAVFEPGAGDKERDEFSSAEAQLLNQDPLLLNC